MTNQVQNRRTLPANHSQINDKMKWGSNNDGLQFRRKKKKKSAIHGFENFTTINLDVGVGRREEFFKMSFFFAPKAFSWRFGATMEMRNWFWQIGSSCGRIGEMKWNKIERNFIGRVKRQAASGLKTPEKWLLLKKHRCPWGRENEEDNIYVEEKFFIAIPWKQAK